MLRDAFYRLKPVYSDKASIRHAWMIYTLGIADRHTIYIHDLIESGRLGETDLSRVATKGFQFPGRTT